MTITQMMRLWSLLLRSTLLFLAFSPSRGATLGKRGDTGQDGADLVLRLSPPSPPRDPAPSSAAGSTHAPPFSLHPPWPSIPAIDQAHLSPQLRSPSPPQHEDPLYRHPVFSGTSFPARTQHIRNVEQPMEVDSAPSQIESGETSGRQPERYRLFGVDLEAAQEGQAVRSYPVLPKPPAQHPINVDIPDEMSSLTEWQTSADPLKQHSRSQWRLFGQGGEVIAEKGHAPGDMRMYNGRGEVTDVADAPQASLDKAKDKFPKKGSLQWSTQVQLALKSIKPPSELIPESTYSPTHLPTILEEYRTQHLRHPIPLVIFQGTFFPESAQQLQKRIDVLAKIEAAILRSPPRPLTEDERHLLTEGQFRDWRKVAAAVSGEQGFQKKAPVEVIRALDEDAGLIRRIEKTIYRLALRW